MKIVQFLIVLYAQETHGLVNSNVKNLAEATLFLMPSLSVLLGK